MLFERIGKLGTKYILKMAKRDLTNFLGCAILLVGKLKRRDKMRTKAERRAYLKEINKRTPEEVRRMHQDWIDNRDKTCEAIAKAVVSRLRNKSKGGIK